MLFLAMYEGLWSSAGHGAASWRYIDTLPTRLIRHIDLSPDFVHDRTLFASTYGGGNLWSTDGGASWSFRNTGMKGPYTDGSEISPNYAADGTAFSSSENGLERTTDRGNTWVLMTGPGTSAYPRALAVSPSFAQDGTVLIGLTPDTALAPLYRSTDDGDHWAPVAPAGAAGIVSVAFSPNFSADRTAIAADPENGAYESTDSGVTWNLMSGLPTSQIVLVEFSPDFAADRTMFAAGMTGGIFKSVDGGSSWSTLPETTSLRALALAVSPNYVSDRLLFAGTIQKGLVEFTGGGANMVPVTSFPDNFVTAIGLSPGFAADRTIYASGYHGLFKSKNGGSSWAYAGEPARIEDSQTSSGPLEEPPVITYQGKWLNTTPSATASTNGLMQSGAAQDTAILNFTGSGVTWVGSRGPQQGSASLRLDGISKGAVSLSAPVDLYQQPIWQIKGLPCGRHTLAVTAGSAAPISVDAFDVWTNYCPIQ